eukprot:m51a1_g13310 hypothetical protein (172) ;mRNA; r:271-2123
MSGKTGLIDLLCWYIAEKGTAKVLRVNGSHVNFAQYEGQENGASIMIAHDTEGAVDFGKGLQAGSCIIPECAVYQDRKLMGFIDFIVQGSQMWALECLFQGKVDFCGMKQKLSVDFHYKKGTFTPTTSDDTWVVEFDNTFCRASIYSKDGHVCTRLITGTFSVSATARNQK